MAYHCAVAGCSNGSYRLKRWEKAECDIHQVSPTSDQCDCQPPFRLFPIPTRKKLPAARDKWGVLNRLNASGKLLSPSKDQRVCSVHFIDGQPTKENPYPTKDLGYADYQKKVQRVLRFEDAMQSHIRDKHPDMPGISTGGVSEDTVTLTEGLHAQSAPATMATDSPAVMCILTLVFVVLMLVVCLQFLFRDFIRVAVDSDHAQLKAEIEALKSKLLQSVPATPSSPKKSRTMKAENVSQCNRVAPNMFNKFLTEKNVNYYTGIQTKRLMKIIHNYVYPFVRRRYQGQAKCSDTRRNFKKPPKKFGPSRFLRSIDELLLTLMRVRLRLDLIDLSDRFCISCSLASKIFTAWIRALAAVLSSMVYIPDMEAVIATKPSRYRSENLSNLIAIIDCTELFIETPHDFVLQSTTWSSYKHHNTLKILVGVCPNSFICYVSPVYEGRISDTELTKDCKFLELLPPRSAVMADKGFNLSTLCTHLSLTLHVPPGRRGQSQMPTADVIKTKRIANLRILVEQVIRRLKSFKLLKNELTLSAAQNIDDVVTVCAALSNLKGPVYCE